MKALAGLLIVVALSGCAQMQALQANDSRQSATASGAQASTKFVDIAIPADALGARDARLTEVLAKVGAVASKQSRPTRIVIAALAQDFPYLNQSVKRGIAPARAGSIQIENVTVGSCRPYSVQVLPTE